MPTEDYQQIKLDVLKVSQPIGDFYIATMNCQDLVAITFFDVRRVLMQERDVEKYLGIQRPLNKARVKELELYVNSPDACFPTGIIIAVDPLCVDLDEEAKSLTLHNYIDQDDDSNSIYFRKIARVLDGQHRLAGLEDYLGDFQVNVSIFVGADISDQANIFSTVNLAQTKVNKSLTYDLYEVMKTRSPQKVCHEIAVTLDREEGSPFYHKIKRLGVATPNRDRNEETLTQATLINPLIKFLSADEFLDRKFYLEGKKPEKLDPVKLRRHPFQHMFVDQKDFEITDILWNYFSAVKRKWPNAWDSRDRGLMLNRTNGYRALMRFLKNIYKPEDGVPSIDHFYTFFDSVTLGDDDLNSENFLPGSSGESTLFHRLMEDNDLIV